LETRGCKPTARGESRVAAIREKPLTEAMSEKKREIKTRFSTSSRTRYEEEEGKRGIKGREIGGEDGVVQFGGLQGKKIGHQLQWLSHLPLA